MTWIKTVSLAEADPALQQAMLEQQASYPPEYASAVPGLSDTGQGGIVAAHSLIPEALRHAFATFAACMSPALPLNRRQHEIIATIVSTANCTRYCSLSHTEFLRQVTQDEEFARCVAADYHTSDLSDAERAMAEYCIQVTRDATQITRDHHARLRAAGFDDVAILQITMIAAWFNYINRMADALGVGRE